MAIYLPNKAFALLHTEIRKCFKLGTDSAISRVCQRMNMQLYRDKNLSKQLESRLN